MGVEKILSRAQAETLISSILRALTSSQAKLLQVNYRTIRKLQTGKVIKLRERTIEKWAKRLKIIIKN